MKTPEQLAEEFSNFFTGERRKTMAKKSWWTGYKAAQQWISVKERLPEDGVEVIVVSDGTACASWHEAGDFGWSVGGKVTHWMPLPEAPKEEK